MKKKWLIGLAMVVFLLVIVWEIVCYVVISHDVQKTIVDIQTGRAVWSDYYELDLSEHLMEYLLEEENPGIVTKIMMDAQVKSEVSVPLFHRSKVVFVITTLDYDGFAQHCVENGIIDYEQVLAKFEEYKIVGERTIYEVPVTWEWNILRCEKNLKDITFVDAVTGGFVSYYSEFMNVAEEDLEQFLGGWLNETED